VGAKAFNPLISRERCDEAFLEGDELGNVNKRVIGH